MGFPHPRPGVTPLIPKSGKHLYRKHLVNFWASPVFLVFWLLGGLITFHEYKFFLFLHNGHFLDFVGSQNVCLDGFVLGYKKVAPSVCLAEGGRDSSLGNAQVDEAFL